MNNLNITSFNIKAIHDRIAHLPEDRQEHIQTMISYQCAIESAIIELFDDPVTESELCSIPDNDNRGLEIAREYKIAREQLNNTMQLCNALVVSFQVIDSSNNLISPLFETREQAKTRLSEIKSTSPTAKIGKFTFEFLSENDERRTELINSIVKA